MVLNSASEPFPLSESHAYVGRHAFQDGLRAAVEAATVQSLQEWWWVDADFHDWPLNERTIVDRLHAWARTGRRLVVIGERFDHLLLNAPRFREWRVQWDHRVDVRQCGKGVLAPDKQGIWSPKWCMVHADAVRLRGRFSRTPEACSALKLAFDACYQQSRPAFPATVLGL